MSEQFASTESEIVLKRDRDSDGEDRRAISIPPAVSRKISAVVRRSRTAVLIAAMIMALCSALAVLLVSVLTDWWMVLFEPASRRTLTSVSIGAMLLLAMGCLISAFRKRMTRQQVVRSIDSQIPDLNERWTSLTSFAESNRDLTMLGSERLIRQVAEEASQLEHRVTPGEIRIGRHVQSAGICLAAVCAVWLGVLLCDPARVALLVKRFFNPSTDLSLTRVQAAPVGTVQARGADLNLSANVTGRVPGSAVVMIRQDDAEETVHPVSFSVEEKSSFQFPLRNLQEGFSFRFRAGDGQTPWHRIDVVDRPELRLVEFVVIPPAYTKLPETRVTGLPKSTRIPQGSRLQLKLEASEALKSLTLKGENDVLVPLQQTAEQTFEWNIELTDSWTFRPILENTSGLQNENPSRCELVVLRDQAPVVSVTEELNNISLRPDDTLMIDFQASDDFGISRAELVVFDPESDTSTDSDSKSDSESVTEPRASKKKTSQELKVIPIPLGAQSGEKSVRAQAELALKDFQLKHGQELAYAIRVYDTKNVATMHHQNESAAESQTAQQSQAGPQQAADQQAADQQQTARNEPSEASRAELPPDSPDVTPGREPENNPPVAAGEQEQEQKPRLAGGNQWSPKDGGPAQPPAKPGSEITGKPRPDFFMAKQALDTSGGQCTSCSRRRIQIDEWAGSFTSRVLDKLQLQIDPILEQLKQELTLARDELQPVCQRHESETDWEKADSAAVRKTDDRLGTAEQHVKSLTEKSSGTPYAFIGLQLRDIQQLHIHPARELLQDVTLADSPANREDLSGSVVHIQRALELLGKLTQQYDEVKQNSKLADAMLRIRKMHQIFLEGTFAMLKSQKPLLNPKERAFMELELSDEYLKQLQAFLKKKLEIQSELAKVLAEDPRLLQRYMARNRLEATTLRDQLTLLNNRQKQLLIATKQGAEAADEETPDEGSKKRFELPDRREKRSAAADHIANKVSELLDNFVVWTPKDIDIEQEDLAAVKTEIMQMVSTATDLARLSRDEESAEALKTADDLYQRLTAFQTSLPALSDRHQSPRLPIHVGNRLQEAASLITDVSGWIRREQLLDENKHHLAAEIDQHRLTVDTMTLNRKLTNLRAQCRGISPELARLAGDFLATMELDLIPEMEDSQMAFNENNIPEAIERQTAAVTFLTEAEQKLDLVMDGMIRHLDSLPYDRSPKSLPQNEPDSLDELLAMLEDEAMAAEALGIPCCRPSNLLIEKDWFKPGSGPGSGRGGSARGQSMQASAQLMQGRLASGRADRIRREMEEAIRKLLKTDDATAAGISPRRKERAWNTLGSKLEEQLRQGQGHQPPEQYRHAIQGYFETLSGVRSP